MTAVATWAAWAFDMMALTVCCRLATAALRLGAWAAGTQPLVPHWAGTAPGDAVSSQPGLRGVADSSGGWLPCSSARLNAASALLLLPLFCLAQGCVYFMVHRMCALLRALSPKRMPVWAGQFNFLKLWAAMAIQSLVLPLCVAYTFAWPHVRWSGVMYYKQAGRIVRVVREAAGVAAGKLG